MKICTPVTTTLGQTDRRAVDRLLSTHHELLIDDHFADDAVHCRFRQFKHFAEHVHAERHVHTAVREQVRT